MQHAFSLLKITAADQVAVVEYVIKAIQILALGISLIQSVGMAA